MAGLPGTGKTQLSEALASRLGGIVLSKDEGPRGTVSVGNH